MKKFFYSVAALLITIQANATTRSVPCSGTITSSVQNAINSSIDGDIVEIGSGSCSLAEISWKDKNITLKGQGIDSTNITFLSTNTIVVDAPAKSSFRITGLTANLGSEDNAGAIQLKNDTSTEQKGFRIDHIKFVTTAAASSGMHRPIQVQGLLYGVIDSSVFNMNHATAGISIDPFLNSEWPGILGGTSWNKPLGLGTDSAVYLEDNTFTFLKAANDGGGAFAIDGAYGMRVVFRHNTVTNGYYMSHWLEGNRRGPVKNEIYENNFVGNLPAYTLPRPVWLGGGTGVIFNNTVSGTGWGTVNFVLEDRRSCDNVCNGNNASDGNMAGESGWPCGDQIGRGGGSFKSQPSVPLYVWNNGASKVELQGTCSTPSLLNAHIKTSAHSNGDKDYCVGDTSMPTSCGNHTNTYTPYTYPHPVTLSGGTNNSTGIASPTGVQIISP